MIAKQRIRLSNAYGYRGKDSEIMTNDNSLFIHISSPKYSQTLLFTLGYHCRHHYCKYHPKEFPPKLFGSLLFLLLKMVLV